MKTLRMKHKSLENELECKREERMECEEQLSNRQYEERILEQRIESFKKQIINKQTLKEVN